MPPMEMYSICVSLHKLKWKHNGGRHFKFQVLKSWHPVGNSRIRNELTIEFLNFLEHKTVSIPCRFAVSTPKHKRTEYSNIYYRSESSDKPQWMKDKTTGEKKNYDIVHNAYNNLTNVPIKASLSILPQFQW